MAKPTWINLSKISGTGNQTIDVTAPEYKGRSSRSGTITATTSGGKSATCLVTQTGSSEFITVPVKSYNVASTGGVVTISGQSNCPLLKISGNSTVLGFTYKLTVNGNELSSWDGKTNTTIANDPGAMDSYDFILSVTIPANESASAQFTLAVIKEPGNVTSGNITINQSAQSISYAKPIITSLAYNNRIPASGGTVTPSVVTYSQTWGYGSSTTNGGTLTGSLTSPIEGAVLTYTGATNTTTGAVTAPSKGTTVSELTVVANVTVKVTVNGKTSDASSSQEVEQDANSATYGNLTISQTTPVSIPAAGQTYQIVPGVKQTVTYSSGASRTESSSTNPVSVFADVAVKAGTAIAGFTLNTTTYRLIVNANPTAAPRNGYTVIISAQGEGGKMATKEIVFNQAAGDSTLSVNPTSMTFEAVGGTQTLTITSNDSWTIS